MKKYVLHMGGVILLALSLAAVYTGVKGLHSLPGENDYTDMGVHVFVPYSVYPAKVEDNSPASGIRMRQRSTVYIVAYRTAEEPGYRWEKHAGTVRELAERTLREGLPVERRVMKSEKTGRYITVSPQKKTGQFMGSLRRTYSMMAGLGTAYIVIYITGHYIAYRRRAG